MPKDKHKKGDKKKKAGKKESQLAIRIEKSERDAFVALCDSLDTSAAREILRFMRDFVAQHQAREAAAVPASPQEPDPEPQAEAAKPEEAPTRRGRSPAKPAAARTEPAAASANDAPEDAGPESPKRPRKAAPKATAD